MLIYKSQFVSWLILKKNNVSFKLRRYAPNMYMKYLDSYK